MAVIRRSTNKTTLLKRAQLGTISTVEEVLDLAKKNNIKTVPLDVEALLTLLGVKVQYDNDLDQSISGSLRKHEETWICTVNGKHHQTRQRFTLAHELAHYLLHRNDSSEFIDRTYFRNADSKDAMEHEANSFAASLLMPDHEFRYFVARVSSSIDDIARHFKTSPLAVRVRGKQLGFSEDG